MADLAHRIRAKAREFINRRFRRRPFPVRLDRPVISFTFDDFPASAYRTGSPILRSGGARGTYYAAFGLMGSVGELGPYFEPSDVRALLEEGHELACHTHDHLACSRTPWREYARNAGRNADAAAELLSGRVLCNFSFPFGDVRLPHKRELAGRFRSMRGIERGLNAGTADRNLLRSVRLYSREGVAPAAFRLIEENARRRGWLVFYTHDVCEDPSAYGCTPGDFESVVAAARESGARLVTVEEALDLARVPR